MPIYTEAFVLIAIGIVAGIINSVAGGGTLLSFPTLMLLGLPGIIANATSTVGMQAGSTASFISYRKEFANQKKWAWILGPPSIVGGLLGAFLLLHTGEAVFRQIVPYLILFATVIFTFQRYVSGWLQLEAKVIHESKYALAAAIFFQFLVAVYGGYFGAGIGIMMLAVLCILVDGDIHEINSLKVLFAAMINGVAVIYFISTHSVRWLEAGLLAVGSIIGGYCGPVMAKKVSPALVKGFVSLVGFSIGIYYLLR